MGQIANTQDTYSTVGIREDLEDVIYNISPEDTPYMSLIGRGKKVTSTLHEWQTDALDAPDGANKQIQGADVTTYKAVTPTVRLQNYTQISTKAIIVDGTVDVVRKAGRTSESGYQKAKRSAELKRDMETILLQNQGALAGDGATAAQTASFLAFIKTNVDMGATGVNPVYVGGLPSGVRTDGTLRSITEPMVKNVAQQIWTQGGTLKYMLVGAAVKQTVSGFSGIATQYQQANGKVATIVAAADVYITDFGTLKIVPTRFQRARDALFVDPSFAYLSYLRPFSIEKLAKTGDANKWFLLAEYIHVVTNELAHGLVADVQA